MIATLILTVGSACLLYISTHTLIKGYKKRSNSHQSDYREATRDIDHKINVWLGQVCGLRDKEDNQRNRQLSKALYEQGESYLTEKELIAMKFSIPIQNYTTIFFSTDWHKQWIYDDRLVILKTVNRRSKT